MKPYPNIGNHIRERTCTIPMLTHYINSLIYQEERMIKHGQFDNKEYKVSIYRARGVCQGIRISLLDQGYSINDLPLIHGLEYPCDTLMVSDDPLLTQKENNWRRMLTSKKIQERIHLRQ